MAVPEREIAGCRESHRKLFDTLAGLTDELARRPSLLPGWTVGHVLTHIARNADSVLRRLDGARRDEVVDQYPGGEAGRAAEIEAGAGRPAAELLTDVTRSARAVDELSGSLPAEAWDRLTRSVSGRLSPASAVLRSRWHEVEVHHVDLGLGYLPERWPTDMVADWLPRQLSGLAQRTDPNALLAWTLGRALAPELAPWG